jgi:hypothetical protein
LVLLLVARSSLQQEVTFSFGYVALQLVLTNERRLLSVENELAIAREIQTSILPQSVLPSVPVIG